MKFSLIKMIFRRYRKIMISLVLIAALASSLMNGMYNTWQSMDVSITKYLTEYGIADAVINTDVTETDVAEVIRRTPGVKRVSARLTGSAQMLTESGKALTAQIISTDKDDILRQYHWENLEDFSGDYLLMDYWFAKMNEISAGDTLRIRTGEDEYRPFTVAAIVSAPETLERTKIDFAAKTYPDFGFVYAPISLLDEETEKESLRMLTEWREKEAEYREAEKELQEAWEEGRAELAKAREELDSQQAAFEEKRAELQEQVRQLTEGRMQLTQGRKELDEAEQTAEERKAQLEQMLERTTGQQLEMEDRIADLKEVRNDLSSLLVRVEDARGKLGVARGQITNARSQLRTALNALKRAQSIWNRAQAAGEAIKLPEGIGTAQIEETLANMGITQENLNSWISEAENGLIELESAEGRIQDGIVEINQTYLPEIQANLEEAEQGMETLMEVHDTLRSGIAEMETGLQTIAAFEREAPENRELIEEKLQEVKEGIQAIYSGLAEGETALAEGREQLEEKTAEAEMAHAEAETELEEGAKSLQEAWDQIMEWKGYTPMRNEFLIWFEPEVTDRRVLLREIEKALDVTVQSSELYDDSQVKLSIDGTLDPMWDLSVVVPLVFVGIMMMVLFLFLSIMIRQSRQHIGILRAMGFSRGEVRRSFSLVCVMMMAVASVIGGAFSVVLTKILNDAFNAHFHLPEYVFEFNWGVLALTSAGIILVSIFAVWLSSGSLNRIQPAEAISRAVAAPPKIGKITQTLLRRVEPLSKFSLLSLKRTPFRFFSSVICLGGAVSSIFASLAFLESKDQVVIQAFDHQMVYDAQIVFVGEPEEGLDEALRGLDSVLAAERYWGWEDNISFGENSFRTLLVFLEPGTEMVSLTDPAGKPISYPTEGIMVSAKCAKELGGIKIGDLVTIGEEEIPVTGISRQMGMDFGYLPMKERERFHKSGQTGWMIRTREGGEAAEVVSLMSGKEGYVTTLWKSLMRKGYSDLMATYDLYMAMLVAICCAVGVLIIVNTGRNNLNEQKLSLSVLRAMGFQHRQIARRWFLQSFLFFVFSLAIGYPVGRTAAIYCLDRMKMSDRAMEYIPAAFQYVWTGILAFGFLVIGHLITVRVMKKWDLVENTKGRE